MLLVSRNIGYLYKRTCNSGAKISKYYKRNALSLLENQSDERLLKLIAQINITSYNILDFRQKKRGSDAVAFSFSLLVLFPLWFKAHGNCLN